MNLICTNTAMYLPIRKPIGFLTLILITGCVSSTTQPAAVQASEPSAYEVTFADPATIDPSVPTPESVIGHRMGDGAVRYDHAIRYLKTLADQSPYVTMTPYAQSHENRTLYFLTITSVNNHEQLDIIKEENAKLGDPRKLNGDREAERIIRDLPGVAWLAYGIHGDELSSVDAAVQLAYQLAAGTDAKTKRLRDELVIHIDPSMNPDGRERYLHQLQSLTGKVPNTDYQAMQHSGLWSAGRGNHYLFDLNRDWLMQVHPETQGRAKQIIEWNPHLVVDSHEMGPLDTYLFDPPREPINLNLTKNNLRWRRRFSADQAKAFDRHGWSYYTGEWYDEWYPGYTNAWSNLQGAIGILYEQAGVDGSGVKQAAGHTLSYRESVHHHYVSSLANLTSLLENRADVMRSFYEDRKSALMNVQGDQTVFLMPPPADRSRFGKFIELLGRHGLEVGFAKQSFSASGTIDLWGDRQRSRRFPKGTLITKVAQPRGRLLRAILEFDPRMTESYLLDERTDLENHRGTRSYDVSAWNVSMAYGLEAYWAKSMEQVRMADSQPVVRDVSLDIGAYGYLIDGVDQDVYTAIIRLLDRSCKLRVAIEPFSVSGHDYQPGAVLLRRLENPDDLIQLIRDAIEGLTITVRSSETALSDKGPDLGGNRFGLLDQPRVAITTQWPISTTSFGAMWHLLDARLGLRCSPISLLSLSRVDLRKYNVIVIPDTRNRGALAAILDEGMRKKLKQWMSAGGTLIATHASAAFLADEDLELSAVRRRRDVLDELAVYQEAIERERRASEVSIDLALIWGDESAVSSANDSSDTADSDDDEKVSDDADKLKRQDEWSRIFSPSGAIASAKLNPRHWITFGLSQGRERPNRLPVFFSGSYALMAKHPVETPVRFDTIDDIRMSGLLWPEARQRWANSAYVTVERVGFGQLILFASEPNYRGYFESSGRLLLNAIILGPGLGASQSVPW